MNTAQVFMGKRGAEQLLGKWMWGFKEGFLGQP